jgi:hypothetical protein
MRLTHYAPQSRFLHHALVAQAPAPIDADVARVGLIGVQRVARPALQFASRRK